MKFLRKSKKKPTMAIILFTFGLILTIFLRSQLYDFNVITHAGAFWVYNHCAKLYENSMDNFEIFLKSAEE